ncbi:MAG: nitroreductase family protein [Proteobacteria bacterium]|nr:nitroreductase family protein [Pseudomonadota bacterium]MBU1708508.1 nitroreductase family protein [Pseudomonadota bacterium]
MIYDLMLKRRSVRRFTKRKPSKKALEMLIGAAALAPSASNKQPWRFHVVRNKDLIKAAAREVEKERRKVILMVIEDFRAQFAEYSKNFLAFEHAPALIVPTCRIFPLLSHLLDENEQSGYSGIINKIEYDSAVISTACAIQNILLMAEDMGLGACCMTGPLIATDALKKTLAIHEDWDIAALIAVGYADEAPPMPSRKPISSILKWHL